MDKQEIKSIILIRLLFLIGGMTVVITVILVFVFLLFLSMDGLASAIDYSSSEGMRTILLGYYGDSYYQIISKEDITEEDIRLKESIEHNIKKEIQLYDKILNGLINGDEDLKLIKTTDNEILYLIKKWKERWEIYKNGLFEVINPDIPKSYWKHYIEKFEVNNAVQLKDIVNNVVFAYTKKSNSILNQIKFSLGIIILVIIIIAFIIITMAYFNLRPINFIIDALKKLSNKDLTVRTALKSKDEIGHLSYFIDNMSISLDKLVGEIRDVSGDVEDVNTELVATVAESGATIEEMVASINNANNSLEKQKEVLNNTVEVINEMIGGTNNIQKHIESQSSAVAQSSASIEAMVSSIQSVTKSTLKAEEIGKELERIAANGGDKIETSITAIEEIQSASKEIAESVAGIMHIASITDMLAMNAAIEAAHAGSAGKGFAVVADEIRNLAENSSHEAKKINTIVNETLNKIEHGVELSKQAGTAFNDILLNIKETVTIIIQIANAMNEQSLGAEEILNAINHIVALSVQIKEAVKSEVVGSQTVLNAISKLEQVTEEIFNASSEQKNGSKEILEAIGQLQEISNKNREIVLNLNRKISLFKVSDIAEKKNK